MPAKVRAILLAAWMALTGAVIALAQSTPNLITGQVPTAAQWNSYFAAKQDVLSAPPLTLSGGTMTGKLTTAQSTTAGAGLNLPPGAAPTTPLNGDVWTTTAGVFSQINGATVGPMFGQNGPKVITTASASGAAGFNLPHGAAPSSPVNGDVWTTTAGVFAQVNGATAGLAALPGAGFGGRIGFKFSINFGNANTDTTAAIAIPAGFTRYRVLEVMISGVGASIATGTMGVFSGAGRTGQTIAANQATNVSATAENTNLNALSLTQTNATTESYTFTTLFIRVGTSGAATTGTVSIYIEPLS
jgi:hypothetical protein